MKLEKYLCMVDGSWMIIITLTFLFLKSKRMKWILIWPLASPCIITQFK